MLNKKLLSNNLYKRVVTVVSVITVTSLAYGSDAPDQNICLDSICIGEPIKQLSVEWKKLYKDNEKVTSWDISRAKANFPTLDNSDLRTITKAQNIGLDRHAIAVLAKNPIICTRQVLRGGWVKGQNSYVIQALPDAQGVWRIISISKGYKVSSANIQRYKLAAKQRYGDLFNPMYGPVKVEPWIGSISLIIDHPLADGIAYMNKKRALKYWGPYFPEFRPEMNMSKGIPMHHSSNPVNDFYKNQSACQVPAKL